MTQYISMLRGINVGGHKKIKMAELRRLYESLGFTHVKTYIQSGNVIFSCTDSDRSELVNKIETHIQQTLGFSVPVILRTKSEFEHVIENNPFNEPAKEDSTKLAVIFLSATPSSSSVKLIDKLEDESGKWRISGKEIYLFYPFGYGKTKMTNNFFEKHLNLTATARNWRTVNKLYELMTTEI